MAEAEIDMEAFERFQAALKALGNGIDENFAQAHEKTVNLAVNVGAIFHILLSRFGITNDEIEQAIELSRKTFNQLKSERETAQTSAEGKAS